MQTGIIIHGRTVHLIGTDGDKPSYWTRGKKGMEGIQ